MIGRVIRHWPTLLALLVLACYSPFLARQAFDRVPGPSPPGVVRRIPVRGRWVALAFDDGPSPLETPRVLQVLAQYHAHASFFVVGLNVHRRESLLRQMMRDGDGVENHTDGHINLAAHSYSQDLADLKAANRAVEMVTGRRPYWLMPPYDAVDPTVRRAAAAAHLHLVEASPGENVANGVLSTAAVIHQVLAHVEPGSIVVLHDGPGNLAVVHALPSILSLLQIEGYRVGSLNQVMLSNRSAWRPSSH
ncbi:polysaccharide deacetylase family protein [Sulfobacillus harzensis]|uniref:Polysaccharide deacetylase family protein n=1 Tax=Sulfobacillus harzensis TaxID=2729629 RepID=A0A7Y0L9G0_9FIRM|nr:polysaccharide deacetylase family protein [Sulfobacillus harzensis]